MNRIARGRICLDLQRRQRNGDGHLPRPGWPKGGDVPFGDRSRDAVGSQPQVAGQGTGRRPLDLVDARRQMGHQRRLRARSRQERPGEDDPARKLRLDRAGETADTPRRSEGRPDRSAATPRDRPRTGSRPRRDCSARPMTRPPWPPLPMPDRIPGSRRHDRGDSEGRPPRRRMRGPLSRQRSGAGRSTEDSETGWAAPWSDRRLATASAPRATSHREN